MDSSELDDGGRLKTLVGSGREGKTEHLFKILVIGELGVGKTSFIKVKCYPILPRKEMRFVIIM